MSDASKPHSRVTRMEGNTLLCARHDAPLAEAVCVECLLDLEDRCERLTERPEWVTCDYQPEKRDGDPGGRSCTEAMNFYANELAGLVEQLEAVQRERDSLMADSWRAFVESGGDPDGDLKWHCSPVMAGVSLIDAVRQLRKDYDEAIAWDGAPNPAKERP